MQDWKPWPSLDSPIHQPGESRNSVIANKSKTFAVRGRAKESQLSDPFPTLPQDAQMLVVNISEMGFARSRVARACKYFGQDRQKVIMIHLMFLLGEKDKMLLTLHKKYLMTHTL